ncbi:multicopper oxidase family protein [Actinomycetota bacterium]
MPRARFAAYVPFAPAGQTIAVADELPGGSLDASDVPAFATPLVIPPAMPRARRIGGKGGPVDYYEIAVRQFRQQMLPGGYPQTTVWGYGPVGGGKGHRLFHAPSATIEADYDVPVRIKWVNELVDASGKALSHLLPVDPTLHWANPERRPGHGGAITDTRPSFEGLTYVPPAEFTDPTTQYTAYRGPVPIVTHVHGAMGIGDESDGYPEAWYLPDATDIPHGYAHHGTWYEFFAGKAASKFGVKWGPGYQISQYPNHNRASILWFHDHTLGMTRQNVYAGPAGFFLVHGGEHGADAVRDSRTGRRAVLPGPQPGHGKGKKPVYDIPLAIQDRSFNADGSLFYPDSRAFFDGYDGPFIPETEVSPIWNPEFFGNTIIVNGRVWPFTDVQRRRYRLRVLNGCNSRVLVLDFSQIPGVEVWQIGNDGGFLPKAHDLAKDKGRLVLAPAERADVIIDFTKVPEGRYAVRNLGPDEPYGGGEPGVDYEPADPETTGRVMQFRVGPRRGADTSTPARYLRLPAPAPLPAAARTRKVALFEHIHDPDGADAPSAALLGVMEGHGGRLKAVPLTWMDPVTENPAVGDTEVWEVYNLTVDAHPVHVHEVAFEVLGRQDMTYDEATGAVTLGASSPPAPGERGRKDTVIAEPGQVTRLKATFKVPGQFVWHCHILEHEDNEMMRPYRVGPLQPGQPADGMPGGGHH